MTAMKILGQIQKLIARHDDPVRYTLPVGDRQVPLNPLFGKRVGLRATGRITCINCGRNSNKSFSQGYCYQCFQKLAQCDSCIIAPERCHYDAGTCREPLWGEHFCMQDHIVYFANSSGLKVGITRSSQLPTRWLDQGATQGLAVLLDGFALAAEAPQGIGQFDAVGPGIRTMRYQLSPQSK